MGANAIAGLYFTDQGNDAIGKFDAFVFGSPTYRATYTAELKYLLDRIPRGMDGEEVAPLRARATAIVLTGASWHHFLALDSLRNVLSGFFGAFVIPPGLYVPRAGFTDEGDLGEEWREQAALQGRDNAVHLFAFGGFPGIAPGAPSSYAAVPSRKRPA